MSGYIADRLSGGLLDLALLFRDANTLGVATVSGGVGVLISDIAEDEGLAMPAMPAAAQERLRALLPYASPANPVDCTASVRTSVATPNGPTVPLRMTSVTRSGGP